MFADEFLPLWFGALMALATLIYAILDGYDLGVGMLLPTDDEEQRDLMIASIGPFWDANETWLVLAIGILLIAFPSAHNVVLHALYIPTALLLVALIVRGVAFDFRAKVAQGNKTYWDIAFKCGSTLAALTQGYMLGMYVMGFEQTFSSYLFAILSAIGVATAYVLIGASWLIMKTEHALQLRAINWAKRALFFSATGIFAICLVNPLVNEFVFMRWFSQPWLLVLPILCFILLAWAYFTLRTLPNDLDKRSWVPFIACAGIFTLNFIGLALSFYPYIVPGKLNLWETASAPESLRFILYGALIVVPFILLYTAFSYRVFWGKVSELRYY